MGTFLTVSTIIGLGVWYFFENQYIAPHEEIKYRYQIRRQQLKMIHQLKMLLMWSILIAFGIIYLLIILDNQ